MHPEHRNRLPAAFVRFHKKNIHQPINRLFEQQARKRPDNLAVRFQGHSLTYSELNHRANRLARRLPQFESGQIQPVGLLIDQGITLIVSILAILKAGLTYAPLDRRLPKELFARTLDNLQPVAILSDKRNLGFAQASACSGCTVFNADAIDSQSSGENLDLSIPPTNPAYIFYTSGSTGEPKGVTDSHQNVLHNVLRYTNNLGFSSTDRMSLVQHCSFSGTVSTLFGALTNGGSVCLYDIDRDGLADIGQWARLEGITIFHSVPSIFRQFAEGFDPYPELRLIRLEGDSATPRDIQLFQDTFDDPCTLVNGLGATECGLVCQFFIDQKTKIPGSTVPVGLPVEDVAVCIVDEHGREMPPGVPGEIVVENPHLASGYFRNSERTDARFKHSARGVRTYNTGDVGYKDEDGCLYHLGRKDFQVKILGNNVNIADVESAISNLDCVAEVVVHPYADISGENRLAAYIVPQKGTQPVVTAIREYLETQLSKHMVPGVYGFMDRLPLTQDGKVNRKQLPRPKGIRPSVTSEFVSPQTPMERLVTKTWSDILELDFHSIGVLDSFFDLGGNSINASQVVARIRKQSDCQPEVLTMFEFPTVRGLSQHLLADSESVADNSPKVAERSARQRAALNTFKSRSLSGLSLSVCKSTDAD